MLPRTVFDEVFFVDLPHDEERIAIFKVHLARRRVDAGSVGKWVNVRISDGSRESFENRGLAAGANWI
jgi:SpoVK/Ycf46/Vps4 family AAA+-type ATPase